MLSVNDNRIPADIRRKKLRFRAWHRGMKEMDIILGNFADKRLDQFDESQLDVFEALLHIPDQVLYSMLVHGAEIPPQVNGPIFQDIFQFAKDPLGSP
ncbi:MAG TPA: succinate dehydrogenase assembly factor 2 [Rhodospirillaceae bacterium]|jgi:antitoxin CptB|nr:succinate dehydrogenase assembly factor 2 [Rhodospirillaceae bacterium]MAX61468.1 succinate dehydrogenase assembly factor 2 [Rhodospirillaceae bacterium]MBB59097.1 succinate dehydrogenase assembly factor 2 [Rhodospirillaceae bacterium]HAE02627.1 succinate dehydrogenase assembly factor 2 [Rhodospirillaceae bacterium]HAJ22673.1 succinate dehydrogenase assembly factor 2 [Rhodospirillaceae bacterium]|tara:strand:- start:11249 stop:11542 length:294 start_codon:yes stop_codon:yes gene_type:complete